MEFIVGRHALVVIATVCLLVAVVVGVDTRAERMSRKKYITNHTIKDGFSNGLASYTHILDDISRGRKPHLISALCRMGPISPERPNLLVGFRNGVVKGEVSVTECAVEELLKAAVARELILQSRRKIPCVETNRAEEACGKPVHKKSSNQKAKKQLFLLHATTPVLCQGEWLKVRTLTSA